MSQTFAPPRPTPRSITIDRLPQAEWGRLAGTELDHLTGLVDAGPLDGIIVFIVQDEAQRILACWSRLRAEHVEGLWIAPDYRGHAGVGRALFSAMIESLRADGITGVLTSSVSEEIDQMLEKLGAKEVPGRLWSVPVPEEG
jgi:ribosomal protein S18 acetylase RimI-like enzyme